MDKNCYIGLILICLVFQDITSQEPLFNSGNSKLVIAMQGDNVVLPCTTEVNLTDMYQVNWTKSNGEQVTFNKAVTIPDTRISLLEGWSLQIENVDIMDIGEYICDVDTDPPTQTHLHLEVKTPVLDLADPAATESITTEPTTEDPNTCSYERPCQNGGLCDTGACNCSVGYSGPHCETPTVCPPGACNINNSRDCTVKMRSGSYSFECNCHPFYTGTQCEIYDHCEFYPCLNRGVCELLHPQPGYRCVCRTGDPNNDCRLNDNTDDCRTRPPSSEKRYITCIDKIASYQMYCSPGHTGDGCRVDNQDPDLFCNRRGMGYCADEGFCKPLCNVDACNGTQNCEFTANPYNASGFVQKPDCVKAFGDGYDHPNCHDEETLFDGFDTKINTLLDCSPFFDTICTQDFGNGDCRPECNNEDCLYDGFDCSGANRTYLPGVVVVELKGQLEMSVNLIQKNMSLMLRSGVNLTVENYLHEPTTLLQLRVTDTEFTDIDYAGKFLAAAVAKRPEWLERVKIKDIYVCPAGKYSQMYSDKCRTSCGGCGQEGDVCDWKTGECLFGCQDAHWGAQCEPCDSCVQQGDVCEMYTGNCIFGCKPGYYGDQCLPCAISCKRAGDICNNQTGECLHGCVSHDFYGTMCLQCPQNCVGGCNDSGICNECSSGRFGETCETACDQYCRNNTCDMITGVCRCDTGTFWHNSWCELCSTGCSSICDATSGGCDCRDGYYGSTCYFHCTDTCLKGTCFANGTCNKGCVAGFHGPLCERACPGGCNECSRGEGVCDDNCKPGFKGTYCEPQARETYAEDVTDNTGVIIGIVISFLLVALILAVACCYWRRRHSGDYIMEDEEIDDQMIKESTTEVHTNTHMQPTSPLLSHSTDMIELDEKQHFAVYAGPGRTPADDMSNDKEPKDQDNKLDTVQPADDSNVEPADDKADDATDTADDENDGPGVKKKERCMSSVTMELGLGGRVLSVSDGDEVQSPTLSKEADSAIGEDTETEEGTINDSAFDEPPQSPLGEVRAPLASEENILASLGPTQIEYSREDEPAEFDQDKDDADNKSQSSRSSSHRSRSSSSSSSSSKSSKGSNNEPTTEM